MAVQYLFNGPASAGDTSLQFVAREISQVSIECAAVGANNAAVSATIVLEGSNTGQSWIPIAEAKPVGTTRASDGGIAQTNWQLMRARVQAVSDNTQVICAITTKGFPYGT